MKPQPIAERAATPPAMLQAARRILQLLGEGNDELRVITVEKTLDEVRRLVEVVGAARACDRSGIIASARINRHYFIKGELTGPGSAKPLTFQMRLGLASQIFQRPSCSQLYRGRARAPGQGHIAKLRLPGTRGRTHDHAKVHCG